MITLQIKYRVAAERRASFEDMMRRVYPAALAPQKGFVDSRLLRLFDAAVLAEIEATVELYDYQLELTFETEKDRRAWVASPEHDPAFEQVKTYTTDIVHCGWDVVDRFAPTTEEVVSRG